MWGPQGRDSLAAGKHLLIACGFWILMNFGFHLQNHASIFSSILQAFSPWHCGTASPTFWQQTYAICRYTDATWRIVPGMGPFRLLNYNACREGCLDMLSLFDIWRTVYDQIRQTCTCMTQWIPARLHFCQQFAIDIAIFLSGQLCRRDSFAMCFAM